MAILPRHLATPRFTGSPGQAIIPRHCNGAAERVPLHTLSRHVAFIFLLHLGLPAMADPVDTIGVSWSGRATAGACVAGTDGPAAAAYNPSLAGSSGASFLLGSVLLVNKLDPSPPGVSDVQLFVEAGLALPMADFGKRGDLWVAITAMTPARSLYDIDLFDDEAPAYLTFGTRERRLSLATALAWNLRGFLGIGVGFELLPTVTGSVLANLTDVDGDNEFHVDVGYRLSPTAGLFFHVHPDVRIGVNYRAANRTRIDLPVEVEAEGLEMSAAVSAQTYYVPHRLHMGVETALPLGLAAEVALSWYHYGAFPRPSPTVAISNGESPGFPAQTTTGSVGLHDVWSPAISLKLAGECAAALGYRFVPAATDSQTATFNLLDNTRHQLSLGGRVPIPGVTTIGVSSLFVTADISASWLQERRDYKTDLRFDNPGYPAILYGGYRVAGAIGIEVAY